MKPLSLTGYLEGVTFTCGDCGAQGRAVDGISTLLALAGLTVPGPDIHDALFFEAMDGTVWCGECVDRGGHPGPDHAGGNVTRSPEAS